MEDSLDYSMNEPEEDLFGDDDPVDYDDDPPPLPPPVTEGRRNYDHQASSQQGRTADGDSPPPTRQRQQQSEEEDNEPMRKIRKPLLTLKVDRLFSENGIPYLAREFPKLKFKGKGHEASDLKYLLKQYEHWANRVYPKYTFNDFIKRVETLGSKSKEFKTQFRNMRYRSAGIPVPGEGGGEEEREGDGEEEREGDGEEEGDGQEEREENEADERDEEVAAGKELEGVITITDPTSSSINNNSQELRGTDCSLLVNDEDTAALPNSVSITVDDSIPAVPDLWDIQDEEKEENPYDDIGDLLDDDDL